jgi:hypothetical protein
MAIIQYTKDGNLIYEYLAMYPDQYVSEKVKESDDFIKHNMDYFAIQAYAQFTKNKEKVVRNYDLVKGILHPEDFYEHPEVASFIQTIQKDELPPHVKHYPILNPPLNTLVGELSKRPDTIRLKDFSEGGKSDQLQFRTQLLTNYLLQNAREKLFEKFSMEGTDIDELQPQEIEQLTLESIEDQLDTYSSTAEQWGNHVLEALKVQFNLKEKSEDAFRDLLIGSREYYHIYETSKNSLGFDIETVNPKSYWQLSTPDRKYSHDAYTNGTVEVMELSEIIEKFEDLTIEEVEHLKKGTEQFSLLNVRESNLTNPNRPVGINSITYDTYDELVLNERLFMESQLKENSDELADFLGLSNSVTAFGNKFAVVRAYWKSKKKIGKLTYFDEETGKPEIELVDENYENNSVPTQIGEVQWNWMNQWYYGYKIGPDVYHVKPYKLLPYSPIIGVVHEMKNTQARSLVDLMKPYQMIYNVAMNQLWSILEKEIGVVYKVQLRRIPIPKDANAEDSIETWMMEARERGILFEDDSPENLKVPLSNTQTSQAVDLTRTQEIQSRYNLAVQMKLECWELVGLSRERLGMPAASQTATGINTSLSQSYAQTEPYFVQHEYVLNELYQGVLDAALYIESRKPTSTISYITSSGENGFISVNGSDLKLATLGVFVTSRSKDQEAFRKLQDLAQPALQNGASLEEVAEMFTTDSMSKMRKVLKNLKKRQDQMLQQQQDAQQAELQQKEEQFQQQLQAQELTHQEDMINENYQKELDRNSKERIAMLTTFSRQKNNMVDNDNSGVPDMIEISRMAMDQESASRDYNTQLQKLDVERQKLLQDRTSELQQINLEKEKIKVKREEMKSKERIAAKNKNKFDKK